MTGRPLFRLPLSGALTRAIGRHSDLTQRWLGRSLGGAIAESTQILTRGVPTDDARLASELGVRLRPARETLTDALARRRNGLRTWYSRSTSRSMKTGWWRESRVGIARSRGQEASPSPVRGSRAVALA